MQTTRRDLADNLAFREVQLLDTDRLADFYYHSQFQYFLTKATDAELREEAINLAVIDRDEELIIID